MRGEGRQQARLVRHPGPELCEACRYGAERVNIVRFKPKLDPRLRAVIVSDARVWHDRCLKGDCCCDHEVPL